MITIVVISVQFRNFMVYSKCSSDHTEIAVNDKIDGMMRPYVYEKLIILARVKF